MLKLSGEALGGGGVGLDLEVVVAIAAQVREVVEGDVQVGIVVGGGNLVRGAQMAAGGMDRARADYTGMLATVMNALALQDLLEQQGVATRVQSAIEMSQVAEPYIPRRAIRHLEKGRVVIFGAGVGLPFFSTDTAAAQRALEVSCEVLLLAKAVDGVYDADPELNPSARRLEEVSYAEVLRRDLRVADAAAFSLCMQNELPMRVFGLRDPDSIVRAVRGEPIGTLVHL